MSKIVSKDRSVEGLEMFFIQPALASGVILGHLPKVRPASHLSKDVSLKTDFNEWSKCADAHLIAVDSKFDPWDGIITYRSDMSADHESYVFGEGMNQLKQGRTRVWISSQDQTLRPASKEIQVALKRRPPVLDLFFSQKKNNST